MRQPTVRRPWAPRGQTPILKSDDRHDRLSAISALTVSPKRRRLGLYLDILDHNVKADDFEVFVERRLRRIRRPIILVIDRHSVHRSAAKRLLARYPKRLRVEWLPAYAPELNPAEQVWNRTQYTDLAHFAPDDVPHLGRSVNGSLQRTRSQQTPLRSFLNHAKWPLRHVESNIQRSIISNDICSWSSELDNNNNGTWSATAVPSSNITFGFCDVMSATRTSTSNFTGFVICSAVS